MRNYNEEVKETEGMVKCPRCEKHPKPVGKLLCNVCDNFKKTRRLRQTAKILSK